MPLQKRNRARSPEKVPASKSRLTAIDPPGVDVTESSQLCECRVTVIVAFILLSRSTVCLCHQNSGHRPKTLRCFAGIQHRIHFACNWVLEFFLCHSLSSCSKTSCRRFQAEDALRNKLVCVFSIQESSWNRGLVCADVACIEAFRSVVVTLPHRAQRTAAHPRCAGWVTLFFCGLPSSLRCLGRSSSVGLDPPKCIVSRSLMGRSHRCLQRRCHNHLCGLSKP